MTVIVDPAGTREVVYRDPAVTIVEVVATGSDESDAAQLTRYSAVNVVVVTTDQSGRGIKLPAAEEGDFFEIFVVDSGGSYVKIYASNGAEVSGSATKAQYRYAAGGWRNYS